MHRTETIADGVVLHLGDCREIVYTNDDEYTTETPEQRFERMRRWVEQNLRLER